MAKKLLIISVVTLVVGLAFVMGIVNIQSTVALYTVLPLGAVFLGLFLVFRSFEREVSLYDQEQREHPAFREAAASAHAQNCGCSKHAHGKSAVTH